MKRISFLDYAKALSILFVISIHVGFSQLNQVVLFAMPVFFLATGYTFDPTKRTWKAHTALRFRTIMLPFWGFMLLYGVIDILRAQLFHYASWQVLFPWLSNMLYGSGKIPLSGELADYLRSIMAYKVQPSIGVDVILPVNCHVWFLPAMFTGYMVFAALAERARKKPWLGGVSIVALLLFASLEVLFPALCQLPFGIGRGAIGAAFMLIGYFFKQCKAFEKRSVPFYATTCLAAAAVFVTSLLLGSDGSAMVVSYYGPYGFFSVCLTFLGGVAGAWLVFVLCMGLDMLPLPRVKRLLSFVGQNVFTFYLMHMVLKFPLDVLYICGIHNGDRTMLDAFQMGLMPESSAAYMVTSVLLILAGCLLFAWLKTQKKEKEISWNTRQN